MNFLKSLMKVSTPDFSKTLSLKRMGFYKYDNFWNLVLANGKYYMTTVAD